MQAEWREQKKRPQRARFRDEEDIALHNLRTSTLDWNSLQDREWVQPRRSKAGTSATRSTGRRKKPTHSFKPRHKAVRISESISVSKLAGEIGVKGTELLAKLNTLGISVTMNDPIEGSTAELIAADYGITVTLHTDNLEDWTREEPIPPEQLQSKPAVVTVMGHVDHGKTTLVDCIRQSNVASSESGGITQHIGAYRVPVGSGELVFLDTPGHEAFTALRKRGASITDIVVIVVAANDGVMPQTIEAIEHVRAADVPMIIAINKVDHPNADPERTKQNLLEHNVIIEEFGGSIPIALISALKHEGIEALLELIQLQAELLELHSTSTGRCYGTIIEAEIDSKKGPITTVLINRGTLKIGDCFISGTAYGKVRILENEHAQTMKTAQMGMPVRIVGFNAVPVAGDPFVSLPSEKIARQLAENRLSQVTHNTPENVLQDPLETFLNSDSDQTTFRQLNLILKTDTQGSLEAIKDALFKKIDQNANVSVIRSGVGNITESDVDLGVVSQALVVGFHVKADPKIIQLAQQHQVKIRLYTIIYELVDEVLMELEGMLAPVLKEEIVGHCEVRSIFSVSKEGRIAGGYITDGKIDKDCMVRVYREDLVIHKGSLNSLRRYKSDVNVVQSGNECGFRISNYNDLQPGDYIEAYVLVEEKPSIQRA